MSRYQYQYGPRNAFRFENPRDGENSVMVAAGADGSLTVAVAEEKAVDSYNSTFECDITIPRAEALKLRDYLNARLK